MSLPTFRRYIRYFLRRLIRASLRDHGKLRKMPWLADYVPFGFDLQEIAGQDAIKFKQVDGNILLIKGCLPGPRYIVSDTGKALARVYWWRSVNSVLQKLARFDTVRPGYVDAESSERIRYIILIEWCRHGHVRLHIYKFPLDRSRLLHSANLVAAELAKRNRAATRRTSQQNKEVAAGMKEAEAALM